MECCATTRRRSSHLEADARGARHAAARVPRWAGPRDVALDGPRRRHGRGLGCWLGAWCGPGTGGGLHTKEKELITHDRVLKEDEEPMTYDRVLKEEEEPMTYDRVLEEDEEPMTHDKGTRHRIPCTIMRDQPSVLCLRFRS